VTTLQAIHGDAEAVAFDPIVAADPLFETCRAAFKSRKKSAVPHPAMATSALRALHNKYSHRWWHPSRLRR
jgi:hypothetical protein